ncbi:hypothetical protein G6L26_009640 [Agrobacterium radiobacter]|uniref:hypothetical protein n=1 Tax=Agrobacterium tumefaciens complex TaxID=1183400 RepID=UPI00080F9DCB|nr:hypothetical protein [Agrobacterium tumefaciens]NTA05447.1 hypothetical protein [Agrobacterium tumefaciens]NTA92040.1 hypothetical protein [Agrobacterium tumefaciens]OCJ32198.1 hypothetical protein A6U90_09790 [Agrobacterium tumefaciens]
MIAWIVKLLTGSVLDRLTGLYEKKLQADGAAQKLAAEFAVRQIEADLEVRQNAKEIRLATAGFWEMRTITFLIALPFVIHLWAVGLDTVFRFGWGVPKFPSPMDEWEGAILLSFFGVQVISRGFDTLAFIFRGKK